MADQARAHRRAVQPGRRDRRPQPRLAEKLARGSASRSRRCHPRRQHDQGRRPRRQGAARRLHLHDHDDVDAREQHRLLYAKLPFDPVKDFAPITQVSLGSVLLIAAKPTRRTATSRASSPGPRRRTGRSPTARWGIGSSAHRLRRDPGQGLRRPLQPRALQGERAGDHRRHRRQPRCHLRQPGRRQAAGAGRPLKALGMTGPDALGRDARCRDLRRAGLRRASSCRSGSPPTRRPERRKAIVDRLQKEIAAVIRMPDVLPQA